MTNTSQRATHIVIVPLPRVNEKEAHFAHLVAADEDPIVALHRAGLRDFQISPEASLKKLLAQPKIEQAIDKIQSEMPPLDPDEMIRSAERALKRALDANDIARAKQALALCNDLERRYDVNGGAKRGRCGGVRRDHLASVSLSA